MLLEAALEAPDEVAADLSMLSADEANQLLHEFNAMQAPAPADKTLSQLFEAHAAAKPQADCLLNGEHRLTYAEVNYPASIYKTLLHSHEMQAATRSWAYRLMMHTSWTWSLRSACGYTFAIRF